MANKFQASVIFFFENFEFHRKFKVIHTTVMNSEYLTLSHQKSWFWVEDHRSLKILLFPTSTVFDSIALNDSFDEDEVFDLSDSILSAEISLAYFSIFSVFENFFGFLKQPVTDLWGGAESIRFDWYRRWWASWPTTWSIVFRNLPTFLKEQKIFKKFFKVLTIIGHSQLAIFDIILLFTARWVVQMTALNPWQVY